MAHLCVFAKHIGEEKEYIFAVEPPMEVRKDDILLVNTMRGRDIAIATSEMFEGRNIDEVATKYGAYLPLKNVVQVCGKEIRAYLRGEYKQEITNETISRLQGELGRDELPF